MTKFANRNRLNLTLTGMARDARPAVLRAMRRGGLAIENRAVDGIISPPKTGRIYPSKHRKGRTHQASAPGEFPAADSGRLHQSITTATVRDDATSIVVETGANVPYATWLEFGTVNMEPRPFMTPAFRENVQGIERNVAAEVARALRRRRPR